MAPIIAFSGSSHTGKTTLARLLASHLQCKFASFGEYVRSEASRKAIPRPSRRDLQDMGQNLVERDLVPFCRAVLAAADFRPGDRLILDGVRHKEVLQTISKLSQGQPVALIYLHTALKNRMARDESSASEQDLQLEDSHKVESQVHSELRELADLVVETSQGPSSTLSHILSWIEHEWPEMLRLTSKNLTLKEDIT
jgi:cytidylate kinase